MKLQDSSTRTHFSKQFQRLSIHNQQVKAFSRTDATRRKSFYEKLYLRQRQNLLREWISSSSGKVLPLVVELSLAWQHTHGSEAAWNRSVNCFRWNSISIKSIKRASALMLPTLAKYLFIFFYIQMLLSTFRPPLASKAPSGSRAFSHWVRRVKCFRIPGTAWSGAGRPKENTKVARSCSIKHELVIYLCAFFTVHQLFFTLRLAI